MDPEDYYNSSNNYHPYSTKGERPNPFYPKEYDQKPWSEPWADKNPWMKQLNEAHQKRKQEQAEKEKLRKRYWLCINWKRIPKKFFTKT
jgi:hypothetical protein